MCLFCAGHENLDRPRPSGYRRGELSSAFGDGRLLGHGRLSKLDKNATLFDMDDKDRQWEMEFFMEMGKDKGLSRANMDKSWEMEFLLEAKKDEELSDDNMDRSWECRIIARVLATPGSAPTGGWSG